jgi:hypothetical protein
LRVRHDYRNDTLASEKYADAAVLAQEVGRIKATLRQKKAA